MTTLNISDNLIGNVNTYFTDLITSENFVNIPVDVTGSEYDLPARTGALYTPEVMSTMSDITTKDVDGSGTFDILMTSIKNHLAEEYDDNRITGSEYTKAYIELTSTALSVGLQFTLQSKAAHYQAIAVQMQARAAETQNITAGVELAQSKLNLQLADYQTARAKSDFALSKMQLASEAARIEGIEVDTLLGREQTLNATAQRGMINAQIAQATEQTAMITDQRAGVVAETALTASNKSQVDYTNGYILPEQRRRMIYETDVLLPSQKLSTDAQRAQVEYRTANILPEEKRQVIYQTDFVLESQVAQTNYQTDVMMPQQLANVQADTNIKAYQHGFVMPQQVSLIKEQIEVQHAQTSNNRYDSTGVVQGAIGKQKELYTQQIDSYKKADRFKVGKLYSDAWTVQKSLDEGLTAPSQFTNGEIDEVLLALRSDNSLGT